MTGRIPITDVSPTVDAGAYPAKASVGETFTIAATVFREGHDAVNANVVLTSPTGQTRRMLMTPVGLGFGPSPVVEKDPMPPSYVQIALYTPQG